MIEKKVCQKKKVKKMEISLDTTKTEWVVQLGNRLTPEKRRNNEIIWQRRRKTMLTSDQN